MQNLFSDLGMEWSPVVLDSREEMIIILRYVHPKLDLQRYYIAGSTDSSDRKRIRYSDYMLSGSGNAFCVL